MVRHVCPSPGPEGECCICGKLDPTRDTPVLDVILQTRDDLYADHDHAAIWAREAVETAIPRQSMGIDVTNFDSRGICPHHGMVPCLCSNEREIGR